MVDTTHPNKLANDSMNKQYILTIISKQLEVLANSIAQIRSKADPYEQWSIDDFETIESADAWELFNDIREEAESLQHALQLSRHLLDTVRAMN
jgi:hypothetical protein